MQSQEAKNPRILDQVRNTLRLNHYSIHTERTYIDWIKRYIAFHQMQSRDDLVHILQQGGQGVSSSLDDLS